MHNHPVDMLIKPMLQFFTSQLKAFTPSRFFKALALASAMFTAVVVTFSALMVFWLVHVTITLDPPQLNLEFNQRAYGVSLNNPLPTLPTPTPLPTTPPPPGAHITTVVGHAQLSTLDCEARSAVDLAGFFGVTINEKEFLERMPHSTNPNKGFVGNYWDARGKIPPDSYGVYAAPVAALLRSYGLTASEQHGISFEGIKAEIAAGRPVMVWVTGNTQTGWVTSYVTPDGEKIPVSPFEHTVLVVGYDGSYVDIVDGAAHYQRLKPDFLVSWGNLGNMAITVAP